MPGTTSAALLGRLGDWGDQVAWDEFVSRYAPLVRVCCQRFRLDENRTEELCQQIWFDLARRLRTFRYDPGGSFRGWLRRFCRSRVLDRLRAQTPRVEVSLDDVLGARGTYAEDAAFEDAADDPSASRARLLTLASEIQAAVRSQVDPETWQAFWLVAVEDQSVTDAAAQLGKSYAATFAAQKRVRSRLRTVGEKLLAESLGACLQSEESAPRSLRS
jgi:RNA polymerase sigma-70 factor (ECF subfamily)